ncbi:MAG: NAD(P)-dependent oxidoreductase [Deltaproteobacteria bacterium]|nr:NAD(P)-dependent oxidoreductase [Deltaproteobacteria bacterium]
MGGDNLLIFGGSGQLGRHLSQILDCKILTSKDLDFKRTNDIKQILESEKPSVVINCAAFTNVDLAESKREDCFLINLKAVEFISDLARKSRFYFVHISTDYVFDGETGDYQEHSPVNPLNFYGLTKAWSEKMIDTSHHLVIRTSYLFSDFKPNIIKFFCDKVLDRASFSVVGDQLVSITYAKDLAQFINLAVSERLNGIYHFSNLGALSWDNLVEVIQEYFKVKASYEIVEFESFVRPARRPKKSYFNLEKLLKIYPVRDWRVALDDYLFNNYGHN